MCGSICGLVLLVSMLWSSINLGCCQSPCPDYFSYLRDDATGEVMGKIEIPRAPKDVALHLRISLSVAAALPTKYVGTLGLANSRVDAVRAVREGRPLIYHVHFPIRSPIPLLTEITFNEQRYCTGQRATGSIVTTLYLEHTLYPPGVIPLSSGPIRPPSIPEEKWKTPEISPDTVFSPLPTSNPVPDSISPVLSPAEKNPFVEIERPTFTEIEQPIRRPKPETRPFVPTSRIDNIFLRPGSNGLRKACGIPNIGGINYLIAHGEGTSPGQWPWLVAIFVAKLEYEFQCAGSLITDKHIVTAAHCKHLHNVEIPASTFLVSVGRYYLKDWREPGSKNLEVLEFISHPDYRGQDSADGDVGVIILRDRVEFTPRIQPLCLWGGSIGLGNIVGRTGYVVGWGRDEKGHQYLPEPRMILVPIVSQEICLRSNEAFVNSTSSRTFCAGMRDGSGPCNGDSGSGLVIRDSATGRYHLRGIVSLSLSDVDTLACDLSGYVVYADAAKYLDWIRLHTNYS